VFRSEESIKSARKSHIEVTFAAPRHQEQNGISEANWRNVRNLAYACLNEAKMDMSYFPLALEHAWKLHAVLPHIALPKTNGEVQCPLHVFRDKPVKATMSDIRESAARIVRMPRRGFLVQDARNVALGETTLVGRNGAKIVGSVS
jgi:hypothetical protein